MKKIFSFIKNKLPVIIGSAVAMAIISFSIDAVGRCAVPLWHEEPEMPACLKAKIN